MVDAFDLVRVVVFGVPNSATHFAPFLLRTEEQLRPVGRPDAQERLSPTPSSRGASGAKRSFARRSAVAGSLTEADARDGRLRLLRVRSTEHDFGQPLRPQLDVLGSGARRGSGSRGA